MISEKESEYLLSLEKAFKEPDQIIFTEEWSREIESIDWKELFIMDYKKGRIDVSKYTLNHRYRTAITLFRIDMNWAHRNPDWKFIRESHIHVYREWYDIKWAYPLSKFWFKQSDDINIIFEQVLKYLNIRRRYIQTNIELWKTL